MVTFTFYFQLCVFLVKLLLVKTEMLILLLEFVSISKRSNHFNNLKPVVESMLLLHNAITYYIMQVDRIKISYSHSQIVLVFETV